MRLNFSRNYGHLMPGPALFLASVLLLLLTACGSPGPRSLSPSDIAAQRSLPASEKGNEVALYALGLLDIGYRFGGKNPQAGFDCSGMVSYIYDRAVGVKIRGSAADIARKGRPIEPSRLRPGDLVFFNTLNRSFSHVGIYLGDSRFIHAPSTNGRIRIDRLTDRYYVQHFEEARGYFE